MLSKRREQFVMLLGLLVVNSVLGWYLYRQWRNYGGRIRWIYNGVVQEAASVPSTGQAAQVEAQSFAEIVNRNLFRPERTNEVPTESAKAPELPLLYGTMNLGDGLFAMMAPGDQPTALSRPVRPGEEIGGYRLVSMANSQVVLAWGEKEFTISVWESARRVPRIIEKRGPTVGPAASTAPTASTGPVTTVGPSSASSSISEERKKYTPAGYNAPPGAPPDAPAGTVIGGRRKVVRPTPFGNQVWWENVEQPKNPAQKADEK